jgi:hypothetical protein
MNQALYAHMNNKRKRGKKKEKHELRLKFQKFMSKNPVTIVGRYWEYSVNLFLLMTFSYLIMTYFLRITHLNLCIPNIKK